MQDARTDSQPPAPEEVATSALRHLEELGYSAKTLQNYKRVWAALTRFANAITRSCSSIRNLQHAFLASRGISAGGPRNPTWTQKETCRGVRILIEFQETGTFRRHRKRKEEPWVPERLREEQRHYEVFCQHHLHHRASTLATHRHNVTKFLAFLGSRRISSPEDLQAPLLVAFVADRARYVQPRSLATELGCIRSFLRFLSMRGSIGQDLVAQVRAIRFSKEHRLPPVWPSAAVEALVGAVDRSSTAGKRAYAILLLASQLGLRASDIRGLKLDDIRWSDDRLSLTQSKTGRRLSLPLGEELGRALIDYLRNARPRTHHREVFLKVRAPHEPLGPSNTFQNEIDAALRRAGITLPKGMSHGLHSLRHTLATRLVKSGQRLETVSALLGHQSLESTRIYTHLDVDALRVVALDPEEVLHG